MSQRIFEEYDIFKTMHPLKIQVMKELEENMNGKDMKQATPYLLAAMNQLKENNLSFTKEEISILMGILTKDMNPQEKAKVEMMKNIMRKR
jgi:cell division protein ZapA (FtsZ GTPase activity inhibitor)